MEIEVLQTFRPPNIYSLKSPVIKMRVKLGELSEIPTKDIPNFNHTIIEAFPGLASHKCSKGYEGGFLERLEEGTYLGHVTEHLCLELQNVVGFDTKFGKTRQAVNDVYNIIFEAPNLDVGKASGITMVEIVNKIIKGEKVNFKEEVNKIKNICLENSYGPSTQALFDGAKQRGIPVNEIGTSGIFRLGFGKYQKNISATLFEGTSGIAVDIACDKEITKFMLDEIGIPTPRGLSCNNLKDAQQAAKSLGYPVVLKPKCGNQGKFVYIGLENDEELEAAFFEAATFEKEIIIEKYIVGKDFRLLVVDGKFVAASERIPAHIKGDGQNTIRNLIEFTNKDQRRGVGHQKPLTKIIIDDNTVKILYRQGLCLDAIPEKNKIVWLKDNANLSTGGTAVDCTDYVHPENRRAAELAAKHIGLDIAGVDMVIPDISEPISWTNGAIVEINAAPGIRMHLFPSFGKKRDVVSPILDMIFPKDSPHSVPIIAVTGTNGKTTTTRLLNHMLMKQYNVVGMTTTNGIYINNECIENGDTTGPNSARRILNHRSVEAAVLETARGGIVREGLAYEKADIAVFTNLSEDHLGIDEIRDMQDLLMVKSLVIESVKEKGTCILNADDTWVMKAKERAKGEVLLYSLEYKNIKEHIENGGSAVYLKGKTVFYTKDRVTREVLPVEDIKISLNGILKHNISNALAAIGAGISHKLSLELIREAVKSFEGSAAFNPGRFNIYELGDRRVVLDYAHNIDGYKVTIEGLKKLSSDRLVGIIGVPGDRRDVDVYKIGEISGQSFNKIIIKEDKEKRGRSPMEVANILRNGVLDSGFDEEAVEICLNEVEALKSALSNSEKGDTIVVFYEKLEPLEEVLKGNMDSRINNEISGQNEELKDIVLV